MVILLPGKIHRPEKKTFLLNHSSDFCSYSVLWQLQEEVILCAAATSFEACQNFLGDWGEEFDFAISEKTGVIWVPCQMSQTEKISQRFCTVLIAMQAKQSGDFSPGSCSLRQVQAVCHKQVNSPINSGINSAWFPEDFSPSWWM